MTTASWPARLFELPTRGVLAVVGALNLLAIVVAALTGNLPNWPPAQETFTSRIRTALRSSRSRARQHLGRWPDHDLERHIDLELDLHSMGDRRPPGRARDHRDGEVVASNRALQNLFELVVQGLADFMREAGGPRVVRFLPLFGSLFLFARYATGCSRALMGQIESPSADRGLPHQPGLALKGLFGTRRPASDRTASATSLDGHFPAFKEGPLSAP